MAVKRIYRHTGLAVFLLVLVFFLSDASAQSGRCLSGDCTNGQGVMKMDDGRRYHGEFANGIPNGHGIFTMPDYSRYEGEVKNGEFHGSLATFSCLSCGARLSVNQVRQLPMPPRCPECSEIVKPDVVFFDEQIPPAAMDGAEELLAHVDLLLVTGTSCQVAPASWFPQMVAARGGKILEINLEPTLGGLATLTLAGSFSQMMEGVVEELGIGDFL